MTGRLFLKTFLALGCMIAIALLSANFLASRVLTEHVVNHLRLELEQKAKAAVSANLNAGRSGLYFDRDRLSRYAAALGARVTLIARDGRVIADSSADPSGMANHSDRPELANAFAGRTGWSIRPSKTIGSAFLFVAVPCPVPGGQGALRLAMPVAEVERESAAVRRKILQSMALAFLPGVLIAMYFARRVARDLSEIIHFTGELANGNFQARLRPASAVKLLQGRMLGELALLRSKLNETGSKLERTVQQLQREHSELERLERVRKDFVINVSHELRTPLASIQGYAETLLDGAIDDQENNVRFLKIIRHNAERLTRLTADLLILSRLELKTQDLRFGLHQVNALLADVVDTLYPIVAKKQIAMTHIPCEPDAEGNCNVYCDPQAFYQVVSNLLDNAVKYTPQGGEITLSSRQIAAGPSHWMEVSVRDSGMGIPPEDQPRLFERFYRVDKARSRELGGTGLGLAIVKHLVRVHGGDVRVESVLGSGATFFFTLPASPMDFGAPESELHSEFTAR